MQFYYSYFVSKKIIQYELWLAIRRRRTMRSLRHSRGGRHYETPREFLSSPRAFRRNYGLNGLCLCDKKLKDTNLEMIINGPWMPKNLKYLLTNIQSPFYYKSLREKNFKINGEIMVPPKFSIVFNANDSFLFIKKILSSLLIWRSADIRLNYIDCNELDLTTQILLDAILKDYINFAKTYNKIHTRHCYFTNISGNNIRDVDVRRMIFSVGTPAVLNIKSFNFSDVVSCSLNMFDTDMIRDKKKRIEKKDLDTTDLADYVIGCLQRLNKVLTSKRIDDLCVVIGEALINAEEHSSTHCRYSCGFFKEQELNGKHYGVFRLVIMNFGHTIYEKFKDPDCPNKEIVEKMKALSHKYTTRQFFTPAQFTEETLWTLYALQEGVSSVSPKEFDRGNGSIKFIDSFFKLKGSKDVDQISQLRVISGRSRIVFDGSYEIKNKLDTNGETHRVMTFNDCGDIEEKPDNKYVFANEFYFPGTIISARIFINDDDLIQ